MMLPTAKETTVQPSSSFVMSKYNVKQTKAQVFDSSNYSVIKPNAQVVKVVEFVGTWMISQDKLSPIGTNRAPSAQLNYLQDLTA